VYSDLKHKLQDRQKDPSQLNMSSSIMASSLTGVITAIALNPVFLIKTRMQLQQFQSQGNYKGFSNALKTIWNEEGVRGFYRGLVPGLIGVSHGVLLIVSYEELKKIAKKLFGDDLVLPFVAIELWSLIYRVCITLLHWALLLR
jgi:solute carrier family 25 folate transporter 32